MRENSSRRHAKMPLDVIPEPTPDSRTTFILKGLRPAFSGPGDVDFSCGNCGQILIEGAGEGLAIDDVVIKCPNCGSFNEIAPLYV